MSVGHSGVSHNGTVIIAAATGSGQRVAGVCGVHVGATAVYCTIAVGEKRIIHKRYLLICDCLGGWSPCPMNLVASYRGIGWIKIDRLFLKVSCLSLLYENNKYYIQINAILRLYYSYNTNIDCIRMNAKIKTN